MLDAQCLVIRFRAPGFELEADEVTQAMHLCNKIQLAQFIA